MVSCIPEDEKVQHDACRQVGKFAFEHMFSQTLRWFCTPSCQYERTNCTGDSCFEGKWPGAGSDFYIPSN